MKALHLRLVLMVCCAAALLLSACEHKKLCYDHGHYVDFTVRFNWDAAPGADPQTMVVNFFTLDGRHVDRREFTSRHGGTIRLEAGEYRILFHNGEMENVREAADNYDRYSLTTVPEALLAPMSRDFEAPPRPSVSADEPVRSPAETVWAGNHEYVLIEPAKDGQGVELHPAEVTARYTVEVVNVENLRDNIFLSAALSGLSERFNILGTTAVGRPVTVPFKIERSGENSIKAAFVTFGHCPDDNTVSHILTIYTSSKTYHNFDVTNQVHEAPDSKNIYIRVDGLKLPAEGDNVSPSIDDWGAIENVEIEMR